jgi:hypothetical protein
MGADELGAMQAAFRNISSEASNERAGRARLSWNIGWDREAIAEPVKTAARKNLPLASIQLHQLAKLMPGKAHVRTPAREVDRIIDRKAASGELFRPAFRIIVDSEKARPWRCQAWMIDEREMVKAEVKHGIA